MSMTDPLNQLGSSWYHSESSGIPYFPNQFLGWNFFDVSYSKTALVVFMKNENLERMQF
jgi:hypothetical protein